MSEKRIPIAIQLYSLRDVAPGDVRGTLRRLADMGYEGVELAGYYGLSGPELRKMLDDCGLRCAGAHVGLNLLEGDALAETVSTNKALGNDLLIVPWSDMSKVSETIERLNAIHAQVKAHGMRLAYHNHKQEFDLVDGTTIFDRIFSETPEELLVQLDIGWAAAAGQDVPAIFRQYSQRLETVHVKEFSSENPKAAVGEGSVDWAPLFDILERETVVKWYVVEQEQYEIDSMTSVKTCIDNIRKLGR